MSRRFFSGNTFRRSAAQPDHTDFITRTREGTLPNIAVLTQKYNRERDFLHSRMPRENEDIINALAELDEEVLFGRLLENDEKFLALRCFLAAKLPGYQEEIDFESGYMIVNHNDKTSFIAIEELSENTQDANIEENQVKILKHLANGLTTYIPLFIHGNHFTLLVIDPDTRTFRYIDSMQNSRNGDISPRQARESILLGNLKDALTGHGYRPSGAEYFANQYSQLLQLGHDQKNINNGIRVSDEDVQHMPSHNNECGFHVSGAIMQMIRDGMNCDLSRNFNPIMSILVTRPAFDSLFLELRGRDAVASASKEASPPSSKDKHQQSSKDKLSQTASASVSRASAPRTSTAPTSSAAASASPADSTVSRGSSTSRYHTSGFTNTHKFH